MSHFLLEAGRFTHCLDCTVRGGRKRLCNKRHRGQGWLHQAFCPIHRPSGEGFTNILVNMFCTGKL